MPMMMTLFSSPIDSFSLLYRRVVSACFPPPILQPLPVVSFSANILHPNPLAGSSAFVTMVSHNFVVTNDIATGATYELSGYHYSAITAI